MLTPDNPENTWYYDFLNGTDSYSLNVDNDEAAKNEITVFVNCKISDSGGRTMGIVGVGLTVRNLQELLRSYEHQYGLKALLADESGVIQISSEDTGDEKISLFNTSACADSETVILASKNSRQTFWNQDGPDQRFVAAQYVPDLKWYLVVESDTGHIYRQFGRLFLIGLTITVLTTLLILYIINRIIFSYNRKTLRTARTSLRKRNTNQKYSSWPSMILLPEFTTKAPRKNKSAKFWNIRTKTICTRSLWST